ncbi:MAG TPA: hypothetical protein VJC21_02365 [Candidatus Nanoarchaeia archaeon]|nr:hypothetical protein [Candidatus Nanoarchaeia archaeon]
MFGIYLTGPFGQSQALYQARNEEKRGRGTKEAVSQQMIKDTQEVLAFQQAAHLDFVIDPSFSLYYLFQPFAEQVEGVRVGPQENWFNNNVFYWRPQIHGPLRMQTGFTEKYLHLGHFPHTISLAVLPSPYTLLMLSDAQGYADTGAAITNLAELLAAEAQHLVTKGIRRIQYDEPAIVVKQSLGSLREEDLSLLRRAMDICGHISGASTCLHTYFGDAGPLLPYLSALPVDGIGVDGTETSLNDILKQTYKNKEIALGLVDARNTSLENPEELVEKVRKVAEKTHPKKVWLTPNTGTEYRGFTHAAQKVAILGEAKRILEMEVREHE